MASRKHAEVIKAWADGAKIQGRPEQEEGCDKYWTDQKKPNWHDLWEYRIKPAEPERPLLETDMEDKELHRIWNDSRSGIGVDAVAKAHRDIANAALRHAQDAGQIVTRAEFDRAVGDRAARDMAVAEAMKSAALDWAGRQLTSMPKRLENIDTAAVIASVK